MEESREVVVMISTDYGPAGVRICHNHHHHLLSSNLEQSAPVPRWMVGSHSDGRGRGQAGWLGWAIGT
jgi:hypothetical protein